MSFQSTLPMLSFHHHIFSSLWLALRPRSLKRAALSYTRCVKGEAMKVDVISVVVMIFCLCVCLTIAAQAKTLFSAPTTEVVVKAP